MIFPIDPKISNYELNRLFFNQTNPNRKFPNNNTNYGQLMFNDRYLNYKNTTAVIFHPNEYFKNPSVAKGHNRLNVESKLPPNVIARKILRLAQYYKITGIKSKTWMELIKIIEVKSKWYHFYEKTNKSMSLKEFMETKALDEIEKLISVLIEEREYINLNYNFTKNKLSNESGYQLESLLMILKPKAIRHIRNTLRIIKMFSYFLTSKNKKGVKKKVDDIMKSLNKMKARATKKLNEAVDEFVKTPFEFFIAQFRKGGLRHRNYIELLLNVNKKRIKKYLENLSNAIESNKRFNEAHKLTLKKKFTENMMPYSKRHMPNKNLEKTKIAKTRLANGPLTMMNEWHKARFNSGPHENLGPISLKKLYGKKTKRSSSPPASLGK